MARLQSVVEFAADVGINPSAIYKIEKGLTTPRMSTLRRLAEALGVDITELLDTTDAVA